MRWPMQILIKSNHREKHIQKDPRNLWMLSNGRVKRFQKLIDTNKIIIDKIIKSQEHKPTKLVSIGLHQISMQKYEYC